MGLWLHKITKLRKNLPALTPVTSSVTMRSGMSLKSTSPTTDIIIASYTESRILFVRSSQKGSQLENSILQRFANF
jgi:hypothetical protein